MKRIRLEQKTILKAVIACFAVSVLLLSSYMVIAQSLTDGEYEGYFANVNDDDKNVKTSIIITSIDAADIKIMLFNRDGSPRHETDWISFGEHEKKFFRVWDLIGDSQYFLGSAVIKSNKPFTAMVRTFLSGSQVGKQMLETQITPVLSLDNIVSQLSQMNIKLDELATTTDNIETKVDNIEGNQYVPFLATFETTHTLDEAGGGDDYDKLQIDSSASTGDFIITSIILKVEGNDEGEDYLNVMWIKFDGSYLGWWKTEDLTGNWVGTVAVELLGQPLDSRLGSTLPYQIVADCTGSPDIELELRCNATTGSDITIPVGGVIVSGWKQAGDTITVTLTE